MLFNTIVNDNKLIRVLSDEAVLTVTELSSSIKKTVEKTYSCIKLRGEVSGVKRASSGHTYLSLKDDDSTINAICWKSTTINFPLEDGMEIIVRGRITTYPERSQYQFIIDEASMAGEGALLKLLHDRKKRFSELGYFNKQNAIPKFPQIIGIVTSATGAVLHDMKHRLEDRYQFCDVIVWPVNVQGSLASEQIANAVKGFNFMPEKKPDVLVIARGGGSIEDLWPFNEEIVIKAVFDSKIPVVSAIGHETDTTLVDYAADLRAPTPTAAIELITPYLPDVKLQISEAIGRLRCSIAHIVRNLENRTVYITKCFLSSNFLILSIQQKLDDKIGKLLFLGNGYFQRVFARLQSKKLINLNSYLFLKKQQYETCNNQLAKQMSDFFRQNQKDLGVLRNRLEQSSFKKILEKGFCFITDRTGQTIKKRSDLEKSDEREFVVHFQDGKSQIKKLVN